MTAFPEAFAILRTLSSRGPFWQILEVNFHTYNGPNHVYCDFKTHGRFESCQQIDEVILEEHHPISPKSVNFRFGNRDFREFTYYKVPIQLRIFDEVIPVINFNYKAWLPRPSHRIPVDQREGVTMRYHEVERLFGIYSRSQSNNQSSFFQDLPHRSPTPPRLSRSENPSPLSVASEESTLSTYSLPFGGGPMEFPPLPPSPPSTSPVSRPLVLPEHVGYLLIESAHVGQDSCPISQTPFRELQTLSATSCFHVFDHDSLNTWLSQNNICPVCRTGITNVVSKNF
jgi:hypothetical protein